MRNWLPFGLVLVLLAAACAPAAPPAPTQASAPAAAAPTQASAAAAAATPATGAATGKELVIGGSMALTGPFSEPGKWFQRVYEWYFADLNAHGGLLGRPVKLVLYDDESDPNKAAQFYERLISVDKVDLLLHPYPTPTSASVIPIAERNGMVNINASTAASSLLRGRGNRYTFSALTQLDSTLMSGYFDWLLTLPEAQRPKSAAVFTLNNPFTLGVQKGLLADVGRTGMQVVVNEQYDQATTDFTALIQKAKSSGAEAVIMLSYYPDSVLLTRTMAEQGYKPKTTFNAISSALPTWTTDLKDLGEGAITNVSVWHTFPYKDTDRLYKFVQDQFQVTTIPAHAGYALTSLQVLRAGVEGCGKVDQDCIANWLRTNSVDTASGTLKFDDEGIPQARSSMVQVQGGKNVVIWPKELAAADAVYPLR
jgi:branched-chain amino acid transport system substrate-binding protein